MKKKDRNTDDARDAGAEFFKTNSEALLAAMYHHASATYPDAKDDQLAFGDGFKRARALRDEFLEAKRG